MKLTTLTAGLLLAATSNAQYWEGRPSLAGSERWGSVGFATSDHGFICTGVDDSSINLDDLWQWDPGTNAWTQKADFPGGPRREAAAFSINGIGYVGFGRLGPSGPFFKDLWAYDPATDTWTQKASLPGIGRSSPGVFVLNNKAYVMGGCPGTAPYLNDLWEYDPATDSWQQKANLPGAGRSGPIAFAVYGKGYIGGGNDNSSDLCSTDLWEWTASTNSWVQRADVPGVARRAGNAFVINNIPYAGSGWNGSAYLVDMYTYNPFANSWTPIANFGGAGAFTPVAFTIGGVGYMGTGGTSIGPSTQFWAYKGGPVGIDEPEAAPIIHPVISDGRIVLNGWTPELADHYALLDMTGRRVQQGALNGGSLVLPTDVSDGVYTLQLSREHIATLAWRFVEAN